MTPRHNLVDDALRLHALGLVVQVGELHGHLMVERQQVLLPLGQLLLQLVLLRVVDGGRHFDEQRLALLIASMNRLQNVLLTVLDLYGTLGFEHSTYK